MEITLQLWHLLWSITVGSYFFIPMDTGVYLNTGGRDLLFMILWLIGNLIMWLIYFIIF